MSRQNGTFARPNTKPTVIPSAARDLLFTFPRPTRSPIALTTMRPVRPQIEPQKKT
jgi:hypothetical protein